MARADAGSAEPPDLAVCAARMYEVNVVSAKEVRMLKVVMTVLFLLGAAVAAAGLSVTKVFEGEGIAKFNRWVSSNAKDYPGITPVRISLDESGRQARAPAGSRILFWNDNGTVKKALSVPEKAHFGILGGGRFAWVQLPTTSAVGDGQYTLYDDTGERVLSSAEGEGVPFLLDVDCPLLFRLPFRGDWLATGHELKVLGPAGQLICRLDGASGPWLDVPWSEDTTCVLGEGTGDVVVLNSQGKVLWRKSFGVSVRTAISRDGTRIAVLHGGTVSVYDRAGKLTADHAVALHAGRVGLSANGSHVAVSRKSEVYLFSNKQQRPSWHLNLLEAGPLCYPRGIRVLSDMMVLVLSSQRVYFLDIERGAMLTDPLDLALGTTTLHGRDKTGRSVERTTPDYNWESRLTDNALVVRQQDRFSVYRLRREQ
jgi:hypothetical protein